MKQFLVLFLFLFCINACSYSQDLSGIWRGAMIPNGVKIEKGTVFYLEINAGKTEVTGISREEIYGTETYALKKIAGVAKSSGELQLKQAVVLQKTSPSKITWCRMNIILTYNPTTGYLEGDYESYDCKNTSGKIILYRTTNKFSQDKKPLESHNWFDILKKDLAKGLNAPEIRKKELENFVFEPIYFDYDKDEIRPEYFEFLNGMIKIVESHSDLRVKVTGHTDADGSDNYNDGLSKRRAEAIVVFFTQRGLSRDRLEFDFKGEKQPVDSNDTPEGKQRNRRVDFIFI